MIDLNLKKREIKHLLNVEITLLSKGYLMIWEKLLWKEQDIEIRFWTIKQNPQKLPMSFEKQTKVLHKTPLKTWGRKH